MPLATSGTLAKDTLFRDAVKAGVLTVSLEYLAVPVSPDPTTENANEQRRGLARTFLQGDGYGSDTYLNQFVWR